MDDNRALFSALGSYLFGCLSEDVFPCNCCKNFHSNLHGYCNAHRFSRFHHKFFSRCHLVPNSCRGCHGEVFFLGPKTGPWKKWFLHVPVDSDPFKIGVPWWKPPSSGASKLGTSRSFLSDLRRVWWTSKITGDRHAGFHFTLSSAGQQQMSSMWHHRISMGIMCHVVTCSCWRCHYHPIPLWMYLAFLFWIHFRMPFLAWSISSFCNSSMSSMSSMSSEHYLRPFSGRNWWRFSWCRLRLISNREPCWLWSLSLCHSASLNLAT